jgi:sugar lactone lactonase YvrE
VSHVYTSSGLDQPYGLAFSPSGDLYVSNIGNGTITKTAGGGLQGGATTLFATVADPRGIAFETGRHPNLNVALFSSNAVVQITPTGTTIPYASTLANPMGIALGDTLYVAQWGANSLLRAGVNMSWVTGLHNPEGVAIDTQSNVYVSNTSSGEITKVTPQGQVSRFAHGFFTPDALTFDPAGNLYVSNLDTGVISKVTPDGTVSTYADGLQSPTGLAFHDGQLYVAETSMNRISVISEGGPSPPTGIVAVPGDQSATISWNPSSPDPWGNFQLPTNYVAEVQPTSFGGYWHGPSCATTTTSCTITGLTNGETYKVTVTAIQSGGEITSTDDVLVTPGLNTTTTTTATATLAATGSNLTATLGGAVGLILLGAALRLRKRRLVR